MKLRKIVFWVILFCASGWLAVLAPRPLHAAGVNYYLDSVSGSDSNSGTTSTQAWKTLRNLLNRHFQPGDTINFKRGSSWTGSLYIQDSGTPTSPIIFRDYGSGARPIISYPSSGPGQFAITIHASWVIVQGFLVKDSGDAGVEIDSGSNHNIVQDVELTNDGYGVSINGQYNQVTNSSAYDLKMVVNTPSGNDDYGAVGFLIMNSDNEVSFNRCIRCRAPSYDYGYDGGVVEIYSNGDNSYIHDNYGHASDGFVEVGGGSARNVRIAYNLSDDNYTDFACLHTGGAFASVIDNLRIENNTIVNTTTTGYWVVNCPNTSLSATQLLFRNNIVYSNMPVFFDGSFTHTNNLYYLLGGKSIGYALASSERVADPQFVNMGAGDYHLKSTSLAVNAGLDLGYTMDFDQVAVPQSSEPDLGAFEWVKSGPSVSHTINLYLPLLLY